TYLYHDGSEYVFMDSETFDQISVSPDLIGDPARFLVENTEVQVGVHEGQTLYVELPTNMELTIEENGPGVQGDRSTGGTKSATLQTGAELQVPLFLETGDTVKVDTRDGRYLGRASN